MSSRITLYSKPGCHLCEDARAVIERVCADLGTSYDEAVTQRFHTRKVAVESEPFAVGDVSFHSALCFHTAGPNRTTQPRRALATTYFADGTRVVESPTLISGTWREFLPGVEPGGLAASDLNPVVGRTAS